MLLTISCVGTGLSHIVLGAYIYLAVHDFDLSGLEWIPIISFGTVLFIASCGPLPLPYIILGEVIPDKVN